LARLSRIPEGLDHLKVFIGDPTLDATFDSDKHSVSINDIRSLSRIIRHDHDDFRHYFLAAMPSPAPHPIDFIEAGFERVNASVEDESKVPAPK
jgi:hypothetical protein